MRLKDKVAIVTGGGRGIGRAIALGFAKEGAKIVVAARTESQIRHVAELVQASGCEALSVVCDVSSEPDVRDLVAGVLHAFSKVDILVNNAGISSLRPVWSIPVRSFERVLAVDLVGSFLCTKHVWRPMAEHGGGSMINVASLAGTQGYPLLAAYCAAKWGQIGLTVACAEEGKPVNIRVNAIAPGKADTDFRGQLLEDKAQMLKAEDHVGVCVFLASDEARYVSGQVISLDWFGPQGERS